MVGGAVEEPEERTASDGGIESEREPRTDGGFRCLIYGSSPPPRHLPSPTPPPPRDRTPPPSPLTLPCVVAQ